MLKPSNLPEWATIPSVDPEVGGANIVEPDAGLKQTGWLREQYPPANQMNWLQNLQYQWLSYFDVAAALQRPLFGCLPANNIASPINDTDIQPGTWKAETTGNIYKVSSTITKRISDDWEENPGVSHGGFPSGLTVAINTWYHKFLLGKPDGTSDAGYDVALDASNLMADASGSGYTDYKRVGSIYTLPTRIAKFTAFESQTGVRTFRWLSPSSDGFETVVIDLVNNTPSNVTAHVPLGIKVMATIKGILRAIPNTGPGDSYARFHSTAVADELPLDNSRSNLLIHVSATDQSKDANTEDILIEETGQIRLVMNHATPAIGTSTLIVTTYGWRE